MFQIELSTSPTDKWAERIFRLRYDIYVQEKQYPIPGRETQSILRDSFDDYSINLLLKDCGTAIGTMRVTLSNQGPLEIPQQSDDWASVLAELVSQGKVVAELSRLMVVKSARNSSAVYRLLLCGFQLCHERSASDVYFGAKRSREILLATVRCDQTADYSVYGYNLGPYKLLGTNLTQNAEQLFEALQTRISTN